MAVNYHKVYLVGIVFLGLLIALPGLYQIPFTQSDEHTYFLTALSNQILLGWAFENWPSILTGDFDVGQLRSLYEEQKISFTFPYYYKPLFDLIVLIALYVFGNSLHSILYINLFSFAFSIFSVGVIGRQLLGARVGILAALFFATSGSMLVQARTGMAHLPSVATCLAGIMLYLHFLHGGIKTKHFWSVGVVWGAALAFHPTILPFIVVICAAISFYSWRFGGVKCSIIHSLSLIAGISSLLVSIEIGYQLLSLFFEDVLISTQSWQGRSFRTYFEQILLHKNSVLIGKPTILRKIYTYFGLYWAHEGMIVVLLVTASTIYFLFFRNSLIGILIVALFWLPMVLFICSKNHAVYRYLSGIAIPSVFLTAFFMERILLNIGRRVNIGTRWLYKVIIALVIGVNFSHIQPIYNVGSAWFETANWLKAHGENRVISLARKHLWTTYQIDPIDSVEFNYNVRFLALYKRYENEADTEFIKQFRKFDDPLLTTVHNRSDKLFEKRFLNNSFALHTLEVLPYIGQRFAFLKEHVLNMNNLHRLEIYELKGSVAENDR